MPANKAADFHGERRRKAAGHESRPPGQRRRAVHEARRRGSHTRVIASQREGEKPRGRHRLRHDDDHIDAGGAAHRLPNAPVAFHEKRPGHEQGAAAGGGRQCEERRYPGRRPQPHPGKRLQQQPGVNRHDHGQPAGDDLRDHHRAPTQPGHVQKPRQGERRRQRRQQRHGPGAQVHERHRRCRKQRQHAVDTPEVGGEAAGAQGQRPAGEGQHTGDQALSRALLSEVRHHIRAEGLAHEEQVGHRRRGHAARADPGQEQIGCHQLPEQRAPFDSVSRSMTQTLANVYDNMGQKRKPIPHAACGSRCQRGFGDRPGWQDRARSFCARWP